MNTLDTQQQLFAITAEECGELTQVCMKILRKAKLWSHIDDQQTKRLLEEVGDVYCMLDLIVQHGYLSWDSIIDRSNVKKQKLKTWSNLINVEDKIA